MVEERAEKRQKEVGEKCLGVKHQYKKENIWALGFALRTAYEFYIKYFLFLSLCLSFVFSLSQLSLSSFLQNGKTSAGVFECLGMFLHHLNHWMNSSLVVKPLLWHTMEVLDKKWKEHLISYLLTFWQHGNRALK